MIGFVVATGISMVGQSALAKDVGNYCMRKINNAAWARVQTTFDLEPIRYQDTIRYGNLYRVTYHYRNCEVWADVMVSRLSCRILGVSLNSEDGRGDFSDPFCR